MKRKPPPIQYQIPMGILEITDGIIRILTLGYFTPNLSFKFFVKYTMKEMNQRVSKEARSEKEQAT